MAKHFMIIMSHYSRGLRIGWHYSEEGQLDKNKINSLLSSIKKKSGNTQFGIHKLSTDSVKLESVIKKDQFFKDVIFTEDENEFVNYVASDQSLTPHDISKYILSIWPSSHLKLQKLIYYCYAEFLLKTGEKLFREPIVSYKYGPVVESVFKKFKVHGSSVIDYKEDEKFIN